jgi:tripartite-type tricarboxylate transporter receptor subunit TctC
VHTQAEITERYAGLGVEAAGSTAAEFTEYIKAEEVRFAKVLKETGVKLD